MNKDQLTLKKLKMLYKRASKSREEWIKKEDMNKDLTTLEQEILKEVVEAVDLELEVWMTAHQKLNASFDTHSLMAHMKLILEEELKSVIQRVQEKTRDEVGKRLVNGISLFADKDGFLHKDDIEAIIWGEKNLARKDK